MKKAFVLLLLSLALVACAISRRPAAVFVGGRMEVDPRVTAEGIKQINGPHVVYWNPSFSNSRLLITFGGTTAKAEDLADFAQVAVEQGYHVVSLDYFNSVITTACRDNNETDCFDHFREEIGFGKPVSNLLNVDLHNSIHYRLNSVLVYLAAKDPQWRQFLNKGEIKWGTVVLAGNSQGSGHAAYLSKIYPVARVVMICGPQDHFKDRPAPWVLKNGKTSGDRYYALLHRDDYFDSKLQIETFKELCHCNDLSRVIVSTKKVPDTHNSLLTNLYREEWARMLQLPKD